MVKEVWNHAFFNVPDIAPELAGDRPGMVQLLTGHWDRNAIPDYESAVKEIARQGEEELYLRIQKDREIRAEFPIGDDDIEFVGGGTDDEENYFTPDDGNYADLDTAEYVLRL